MAVILDSREHRDIHFYCLYYILIIIIIIYITSEPPWLLNCEASVCTTMRLVVEADHTSMRCQGLRVRIPAIP